MKKSFLVLAVLAFAFSARAALDTYTLTSHGGVFPATSVTNASALTTVTGDAFDLLQYKGFATITVSHGAELNGATNRVSVLTIQQTNTASGGWSVYRSITNTTPFASFTRVPFEVGKGGRYIRCVFSSTNANSAASASINAFSDQ
jgi:hypothetical protein